MEHDINQSLLRYILRVLLRREFRTFLNDTSFIQAISYAYLKVDILDFVTVLWKNDENEIPRISLHHQFSRKYAEISQRNFGY